MSEQATPSEPSLLFNWAPPKGEKLAIAAFLGASVILHAFCFYLFQIIYPPAVALLSPPARINLVAANSEEGRTVLRWIEAEDPALASATMRGPELKSHTLPKLRHIPSYLTEEPKLKEAPPLDSSPPTPDPFPPAPPAIQKESVAAAWPVIPTHVLFSENLTGFGQASFSQPKFASASGEPPENVRFRIAINGRGEVQYCFRLKSSGDSNLDEQARLYLIRCRFPNHRPATADLETDSLVWGIATIEWGNDVAHPRPISGETAP